MIEVARADAHPIIHQHHFQVQEARLVFEDFHPGPEQAGVIAMPGVTHGRVIGARAGEQKAHIDTATGRAAQ
ncbi:hypothetical protein D3C73_1419250 [compost metagenome]